MFNAVVAGIAVIAFCVQPLLPFVDPDRFMGGSGFLATGIMWSYVDLARRGASWTTLPGIAVGLLGMFLLGTAATDAANRSVANDQRCQHIERDMLSAAPKNPKGPELFQALRCRSQTNLDVAMPAAKSPRVPAAAGGDRRITKPQ